MVPFFLGEYAMSNMSARCQYVDLSTHMECEKWFPYEDGQKFCEFHRNGNGKEIHISRTVTILGNEHVVRMNEEIARCLQMTIPEIAQHIQLIEEKVKELNRDIRAANIAKRNLEDRLTDEERAALRSETKGYRGKEKSYHAKKSPEEKANNRKGGFSAWAARLGLTMNEMFLMDDDERESRIAKYKAAKQA